MKGKRDWDWTYTPTIIPGTPVLRKSLTGFSHEFGSLAQSLRINIPILLSSMSMSDVM
jgi:hypothetical protein